MSPNYGISDFPRDDYHERPLDPEEPEPIPNGRELEMEKIVDRWLDDGMREIIEAMRPDEIQDML